MISLGTKNLADNKLPGVGKDMGELIDNFLLTGKMTSTQMEEQLTKK